MNARPDKPLFEFRTHFDSTLEIGENTLPIKVKRFTRGEQDTFEREWTMHLAPRGLDVAVAFTEAYARQDQPGFAWLRTLLRAVESVKGQLEDASTLEQQRKDQRAFFERTIRDAITIEPGYIVSDGKDVVDGDGFIAVFHARLDVLSDAVFVVYAENRLAPLFRKNSKSPRASDGGSVVPQSVPAPGGNRQEPIAASADASTSVGSEGATGASNSAEASPASSGPLPGDEEKTIH